jgi:hypothetical protein
MILTEIKPYIQDGTFVFTLTNNGYKYFTLNLVNNMKKAKILWKLCIICADKESRRFFQIQGIATVLSTTFVEGTGPNISPFGSRNFQRLNRLKLDLLTSFSKMPEILNGVYMDGDIAVYNDFLPDILERLKLGPALHIQCDESNRQACSEVCANVCTGFLAWSHGLSSSLFNVSEYTDLWKSKPEDQVFVNARLKAENTVFKTLPRDLYPNGQFLSLYTSDSELKAKCKILHYNYLVGMDKQRRMKINGDWLLTVY